MYSMVWPFERLPAHIPSMLQRSSCDLEHLRIGELCKEDIIGCLTLSPNLQRLTIEHVGVLPGGSPSMVSAIFGHLAQAGRSSLTGRTGSMPCPQLRTLSLINCGSLRRYHSTLTKFLASRLHFKISDISTGPCIKEIGWQFLNLDNPAPIVTVDTFLDIWRSSVEENSVLRE